MSSMLVAQYQRWFQYEKDSHAKVLASIDTIPPEQRGTGAYQKVLNLLAHIIAARLMWLFRLGQIETPPPALFPSDASRLELSTGLAQAEAEWSAYFDRLDQADLESVVKYQSYEGSGFRSGLADILVQLHGHSLYHRGQIAMLVRSLGGEPTETDFILWSREPITR